MRKIFSFFCLLIIMLAAPGCVREALETPEGPTMTITATVTDEPLTKAGFSVPASGDGLHLAWQAGDCIRVISGSNSAVYNIQDGFTDHVATFSGPEVPGSVFDVIAPGTYESVDDAEAGNLTLTQNGNGSTAHLVFTAKLGNVAKADLPNIVFSDDWAGKHSGTSFKRGGIVKFTLTLPPAVNAPKKVTMTGIGNDVSVNLTGISLTSEHVLTAYAQSGWDDVSIVPGTTFTVSVLNGDGSSYAATKTITAAKVLKAGAQNLITVNSGFAEQYFAGGDGTKGNPYLIASAKQLDNMHATDPNTGETFLKHQERVYFRLIEDIDMADYLSTHTWVPLNSLSPYDYIIDFDGNNHTIDHFSCAFDATGLSDPAHAAASKPSLFGLLYGSCYDLTFTNATITTNYGTSGVLGGYIGYNGKKAEVYNVHVKNSTVSKTANSGDSGIGTFAGRIAFTYMESCSAEDITINGSGVEFVGGLFGLAMNDASRVRNCWTSGTVIGSQKVGGISGALISSNSEIINCYSVATLTCTRFAGGILGEACMDANSGDPKHYTKATSLKPDNVIQGCIAWQSSFATGDVRPRPVDSWGSGAIIGLTATHNYLTDCKRNASLDSHWTEVNGTTPYDQENASPSAALVINNPAPSTMKHYYPYHGKAYTGTLSDCAKSLGWNETVWDLTGSTPVLTGAIQADGSGETPVSGDANVPAGTDMHREFPTNGSTNTGLTFKVSNIASGIRYYEATGTCNASWMDGGIHRQDLYVVDYDLTNTDYEVKVVVANPSAVTSEVFRMTGAVAAINGGYEKASIAVKGNMFLDTEKEEFVKYATGYPYSFLPNNTISDTGVRNWKNEGAFYCDGHQGVRIAFDAYDGGSTSNTGANTTVKPLKYMRNFYKMCTDSEAGLISSAPILDANYIRFGQTFTTRNPNETSSSEEPARHQSGAYPRTAVAIAYPDGVTPHLLLIVCDGRYSDSVGGYGMSALWLERLVANCFGPKYMLNLDGGGSTTMCVAGKGDEDTHVVNYPSDNNGASGSSGGGTKHNHAGERARDTFIVIVPAE